MKGKLTLFGFFEPRWHRGHKETQRNTEKTT